MPEDGLLDRKHIDWVELLFSSTGRQGRGAFLALGALLLLLALGYRTLADDAVRGWTGWIVYSALLFSTACVLCKRLHDRGRRGWWAFAVVWALMAVWPEPHGVNQVLPALVLLAALVDLGIMPGQPRANRFGPSLAA